MRCPMIFAKGAALLLPVLAMAGPQARAQNQTPANIALVGWTDPDTGLTWTKQDNGSDVNWDQAKAYCSNLRLGGFTDWRLPTIDELQGIYDPSIDVPGLFGGSVKTMHVKGNLKLSGGQCSSTQKNAGYVWHFYFINGERDSSGIFDRARALCVRR